MLFGLNVTNCYTHLQPQLKKNGMIKLEPVGIQYVVMPWNVPHLQAVLQTVPTLMAGNVALFKVSPQTQGFGLLYEHCFNVALKRAGLSHLTSDDPKNEAIIFKTLAIS